jgi:phosphate transport system permease protein
MKRQVQKIFFKKRKNIAEFALRIAVFLATLAVCLILISIISYILFNGISRVNLKFLSEKYSESRAHEKGILPMIINTFYIIIITLAAVMPIGLGTAVWLTEYAKGRFFTKAIKFASDVLAGIPSIIFGLFGYNVFCIKLGCGTSILAGCLTMTLCTLPIAIKMTEEALRSVPESYKESAFALGANKLRVIRTIILPCALPRILTSIMLCAGKVLGESAALIYTSGMAYKMPENFFSHIFSSGRTLTLHLYQVAKQADSADSLAISFAVASVILIFSLIINLAVDLVYLLLKNKK